MTTLWVTIVAVALANVVIKAVGPVLVRGRNLSSGVVAVIAVIAPALLAALVVTETFGEEQRLVLHARAIGVAVAGLVLALRGSVLLAVATKPAPAPSFSCHMAYPTPTPSRPT